MKRTACLLRHPLATTIIVVLFANAVAAQTTERVSTSSTGAQGDGTSGDASISGDGRYVAFSSEATNLVTGDTNGVADVFVHDRQTGVTQRVSVSSAAIEGDGASSSPAISADGRYVAFSSEATNLVASDTNNRADIFVYDRQTSTTERVSVSSAGAQGSNHSTAPSISADGRYVAFRSCAANLVADDTNGKCDVFVRDRQTNVTERISVSSAGAQGDGDSDAPSISADGQFVAFYSYAATLVSADTNGTADVFVRDRQTSTTQRISVSSSATQGDDSSFDPVISADAQYVAFVSFATNLVPDDTNLRYDVFVHDRQAGTTERVSVNASGAEGNDASLAPSISADGRYIAFESFATNLVPDDTNDRFDVFVHDRQTAITDRVSVDSSGAEGNNDSEFPSISESGRFVAFESPASNLVSGDTNLDTDVFVRDRGVWADFDGDSDVDVGDFARFQVCFSGANGTLPDPSCAEADADADLDVDVADFAKFQLCFSGPAHPAACP